MSAAYYFKTLGLADLPEMMEIERSSCDNPWSAQVMRDSLNAAHTRSFGVILNSKLIGYAVLSTVVDEAEILSMTIHPNYQGQGYGKALLNYAIQQAQQAGAEVVYLEVRINHPVAVKLYEKLGFIRIGTRPDYYPNIENIQMGKREDALLMSLVLK